MPRNFGSVALRGVGFGVADPISDSEYQRDLPICVEILEERELVLYA